MNPFAAPKDYAEMLNKIMFYTYFGSLGCTVLIGMVSPEISTFLNKFTITVNVIVFDKLPIAYAIVPLVIALAARISKLHDRISDLFRIREVFDIQEILIPLAGGVGVPVDIKMLAVLKQQRDQLMYKVFYKYASSTKPIIDSHLIIFALDKWSWFWILIELIVVCVIALIVLLILAAHQAAAWLATGIITATLAATFINRACASLAHAQVTEILSDAARGAEIRTVFNAL